MKSIFRRLTPLWVFAFVLFGAGALSFAHHVCQGLSFVAGPNIISEIPFHTQQSTFGVPAHRVSFKEFDHDAVLSFEDGDSFLVRNANGVEENIVLEESDFENIHEVELHHALEVITDKASLLEAFEENSYVIFRGLQGGASAALELVDGTGGPLAQMGISSGLSAGAKNVKFEISVPGLSCGHASEGELVGKPYILLGSQTPGFSNIGGEVVPFGIDLTTIVLLQIAIQYPNALPGFIGHLNETEDAQATLPAKFFQFYYGNQFPDKLYLAYVVMSEDFSTVEYVSNPFTVDFQ